MNRAEFYLEDLASKFSKINPNDYYLAYSGGRDSHFLLWFIRHYLGIKNIPAVFNNTGMEIPEIRTRALYNADVVLKPTLKHDEIKERFGIPLDSKASDEYVYYYQKYRRQGKTDDEMPARVKYNAMRIVDATERGRKTGLLPFSVVNKKTSEAMMAGTLHRVSHLCCKYLKKEPAHEYEKASGRKAILGIMGSESTNRKSKYISCFSKNGKFHPLFDLTEELRDEIEDHCGIEIPRIYRYTNQTGCAGCPYGQHGKDAYKKTDIDLTFCLDGQRDFILSFFGESYKFKGYHFQPIMFL